MLDKKIINKTIEYLEDLIDQTDDKEYQGHDKTELQAEVGCFPKFCKFFHYNFPPYQP